MEQFKKSLKDSAGMRWAMLLLIASVQAANYYFYDAISPLKRLLEENFNISSGEYGLFVAAYSIPNTFLLMAVLGGVILDKLGIRRTGFMFVGVMALGGLITAYGASQYFSNGGFAYGLFSSFLTDYSPELKMMLLGRFFFGLGAETSIVMVSKVIVKWFKGKELAFAFGVKIGLARAGSALALFYSADIAIYASHWNVAIWFAACLLLIAFLAFLVYTIFDIRLDKQLNLNKKAEKQSEGFSFNDLRRLLSNKSFIYVTLLCVTFYSAVFPFQAFSPDFLLNKFGMSLSHSGKIASILYWVTMFATPLFGLVVDKFGRSATLMIYGSILLTLIHLTFAMTHVNPIIPLVLLGIAIALVPAAMWPSVAKIVDEKRIGSAYGAMFSVQNLGLFVFPILVGLILDATNKNSEIVFSSDQMKQLESSKSFNADYLDNKGEPISNKKLIAGLTLFSLPDDFIQAKDEGEYEQQIDKSGTKLWSGKLQSQSDENGAFSASLDEVKTELIDLRFFDIQPGNQILEISSQGDPSRILISSIDFKVDTLDYIQFQSKVPEQFASLLEAGAKINVSLTDTSQNQRILVESHEVFINMDGQLCLKIGKGDIEYINTDFLLKSGNIVAKIKTPLNYNYAILLFAVLGLLGLLFAILLKREDKKSGYGLELPSNQKAKKTK
jgi:nitrate/nitrite transporter NarK